MKTGMYEVVPPPSRLPPVRACGCSHHQMDKPKPSKLSPFLSLHLSPIFFFLNLNVHPPEASGLRLCNSSGSKEREAGTKQPMHPKIIVTCAK